MVVMNMYKYVLVDIFEKQTRGGLEFFHQKNEKIV